MPSKETIAAAIEATRVGVTTSAQPQGAAKLHVLHRAAVQGMPRGATQEVRVILATLLPGDRTPHHTHRFPVTVLMLEGTFTLELDGQPPIAIAAGETFIEPPGIAMTGFNRHPSERAHMALFFVSDPDTPFADPA